MGECRAVTDPLVPMKEQVYKDPRPKEYFDRFHERSRTRPPDPVYEMVRMVTTVYAFTVFRARCIGSDNVPPSGPVILAPNHFSFMDHFFAGAFIRRRVNFMAKSQLFVQPMQFVYTHGGVFPVRRGHADDEAFVTANNLLGRGRTVVIYAEGGRSRTGGLGEPKPGVGRLALESGAPVVPVAIHGSGGARGWKRGQFPQVTVRFGDPIAFQREADPSRERQQEIAVKIFEPVKAMYEEIDARGGKAVEREAKARYPKPVRGRPVRYWY